MLQGYFSVIFYLPAAIFLHPLAFAVHWQLNILYQFWIHTETIPKLGPLEWVLSTPSHHRVHHGSNRYCIDKNYGLLQLRFRYFYFFCAITENDKDGDLNYDHRVPISNQIPDDDFFQVAR